MNRVTKLPPLPQRPVDGHKGTFGRVVIVGGSRGMSGAVSLAGWGALRSGAGLLFLAVPETIQSIVAGVEPSALTRGLSNDADGRIANTDQTKTAIADLSADASAMAIGPGLGTSGELTQLVVELYRSATVPLVVDADALNALSTLKISPKKLPEREHSQSQRILTPHLGEFARLTGESISSITKHREKLAMQFAAENNVVLILKGHRSVVTDGVNIAINTTGNNGMATGGSGDVLTGIVTALLAQKMSSFDAAHLGVHLHGLAGDFAAAEQTQPGMIASDLPRYLPNAWKHLGAQ